MSERFDQNLTAKKENLIEVFAGTEVKDAMFEYGTYTLQDRAVPSLTDGFKPVYRRALYTMYQMDAVAGKPHKKVARITGDVIGKYHPHGDMGVYNVVVEMAHTRYQLVDPQGNFGSDLTGAAAGRYIEARLSKFGTMICDRMNIANMQPNFDGEELEPNTIPTSIPVLLLNGTPTGIAVGLRIGLPSHNITSVTKALTYLLETKKPDHEAFLDLLDRPDFGDCVILSTKEELRDVYRTGYGSIAFGPKHEFKQDGDSIILTIKGIPPGMNAKNAVAKIREEFHAQGLIDYAKTSIVSEKTINGARPICSVSVKAASKKFLEDQILPYFRSNFFVNLHAIINEHNRDEIKIPAFNFFDMSLEWINIQKKYKESELTALLQKRDYEWRIAKARYQIVSDSKNVDKLVALLRSKKESKAEYVQAIMKTFNLDEEQADSLYESKINILAKLNVDALKKKIEDLEDEIAKIKKKLKNIPACVIEDLVEINKIFADENKTVFETDYSVAGDNLKGKALVVGISESGKVYNTDKFPTNVPDHLIKDVSEGAVVVTNEGFAYYYEPNQLVGSLGHSVSGIVPVSDEYLFVLDEENNAILVDDTGDGKKTLMKDMATPILITGLNKGDILYVMKKKCETLELLIDDEFIQRFKRRVGSVGTKLYPGHKNGVTAWPYFRKSKAKVFDVDNESEVSESNITKALDKGSVLVNIFKNNNLARKGTKVQQLDSKAASVQLSTIINI